MKADAEAMDVGSMAAIDVSMREDRILSVRWEESICHRAYGFFCI